MSHYGMTPEMAFKTSMENVNAELKNKGIIVDLYDGALPPGITGPATLTGTST